MDFKFAESNLPRHWHSNDPFKTHFFQRHVGWLFPDA